jgi:hypothetical protein
VCVCVYLWQWSGWWKEGSFASACWRRVAKTSEWLVVQSMSGDALHNVISVYPPDLKFQKGWWQQATRFLATLKVSPPSYQCIQRREPECESAWKQSRKKSYNKLYKKKMLQSENQGKNRRQLKCWSSRTLHLYTKRILLKKKRTSSSSSM